MLSDVDQCLGLQTFDEEDYWDIKNFKDSIDNEFVVFLVATKQNTILGYIVGFIVPSKNDEALVHETRVHKHHRNKGIGTLLNQKFQAFVFAKEVQTIYAVIDSAHIPFYVDSCNFELSRTWQEVKINAK